MSKTSPETIASRNSDIPLCDEFTGEQLRNRVEMDGHGVVTARTLDISFGD